MLILWETGYGLDADSQRDGRRHQERRRVGEEGAFETPAGVDHSRGEGAHNDGDVLRPTEQRVGRHQLVVGDQSRGDGVERCGGEGLDQAEQQTRAR